MNIPASEWVFGAVILAAVVAALLLQYPRMPNQTRVICSQHGASLGYVACKCVMNNGATVAHVEKPSCDELGEILCSKRDHTIYELALCCAACARKRGIDRVGASHRFVQQPFS